MSRRAWLVQVQRCGSKKLGDVANSWETVGSGDTNVNSLWH